MKTDRDRIVFRNENRLHLWCEIAELDNCYELRVQNRKKLVNRAYFDKKQRVLDAVIEKIAQVGNPQWRRTGFQFACTRSRKTTYDCTLAQVVYAALRGIKHDDLPFGDIRCKDGDPFNLRGSNVIQRQKVSVVSLCGERYICIKRMLENGTKAALTDYSEELFAILSQTCWEYDRKKGFCTYGKGRRRWTLPLVVMACLDTGATIEDWEERVIKFRTRLQEEGLSIDHKKASKTAGSIRWDNRRVNLQTLDPKLNSLKNACNQKMPKDCFYIPTADGAEYGRYDKESGTVEVCKQSLDLTKEDIERLKYFCKHGKFAEETDYITYPAESKAAVEIMMADLQEMKLYAEVAYL